MQTLQKRRHRDGLPPAGVGPGGNSLAGERSAAARVADAADRAMLDALADTDAVLKSMPQQTGQ